MRFIDLAPEQLIDEEDENYIDLVYQKQQMFISSMKAKLKPTDFQDDWLSNDLDDVKEIVEENRARKFEKMASAKR